MVTRTIAAAAALVALFSSFGSRAFPPAEFTIIPAAPRYMEPVFLRMKQTAALTQQVIGATVTMNGNNLDVRVATYPDLGAASDDVMLGRLPAGTGTLSFSSATTGVFGYTIDGVSGTKSIQRMPIE